MLLPDGSLSLCQIVQRRDCPDLSSNCLSAIHATGPGSTDGLPRTGSSRRSTTDERPLEMRLPGNVGLLCDGGLSCPADRGGRRGRVRSAVFEDETGGRVRVELEPEYGLVRVRREDEWEEESVGGKMRPRKAESEFVPGLGGVGRTRSADCWARGRASGRTKARMSPRTRRSSGLLRTLIARVGRQPARRRGR